MLLPADPAAFVAGLTDEQALELVKQIRAVEHRAKFCKFEDMYPETGPLRRELYPKHMEFFWAGSKYPQRCASCANRVGKTYGMGGYEFTCHATGLYPDWWDGHRFHGPIDAWAAGDTNQTTRDVIQKVLFGELAYDGNSKLVDQSGLVPVGLSKLDEIIWKNGFPNLIDTIKVKHVSGGWSNIGLKSYEQGRKAFQGTTKDLVWTDEEPPLDVYEEMLIRTMTVSGLTMLTYTPLEGLTGTVLQFMPEDMRPPEDVIQAMGMAS